MALRPFTPMYSIHILLLMYAFDGIYEEAVEELINSSSAKEMYAKVDKVIQEYNIILPKVSLEFLVINYAHPTFVERIINAAHSDQALYNVFHVTLHFLIWYIINVQPYKEVENENK